MKIYKNKNTNKKFKKNDKYKKTLKTNNHNRKQKQNKINQKAGFDLDTFNPIKIFEHKQYFKELDIKDTSLMWGLGIEHEMQIFHQGINVSKNNFEKANIIFDSQESTCFISGDTHPQGACCKKVPGGVCYLNKFQIKNKKFKKKLNSPQNKLTTEESEFLNNLDWELTGRQSSTCAKDPVIIPRTPVLMPELVTSKFRNRSINSIVEESIFQEEKFLECQMKNPFTREKVKYYGPLVTHLCGTLDNIKVPIRPTINKKKYDFEEVKYKDYVGSYHVTITLPHSKDITAKKFVELHRNCANQLQWIEPLMVAAYFSPDPESVGDGEDQIKGSKGSFRVMSVGWGNIAGSDVRKFSSEGIGRGTNTISKWRNGLRLKGTERLNECVKTSKPQYKKALSILTSDFRTFNFEPDIKKCKKLYTSYDCPKIDGGIMEPPFGMEFRIFDHFPSSYLLDLMKIIILIAANADRKPPKKYVYNNKPWIETTQGIMKYGWNYNIKENYLQELRTQFGLKLNINEQPWNSNKNALSVFKCLVAELYELNKSSTIVKIMDETPEIQPRIPEINKLCWELSFNQKYYKTVMKQLKIAKNANIHKGYKKVKPLLFKKMLFNSIDGVKSLLKRKQWHAQFEDLCYALENKNKILLELKHGKIFKIKLLF
jgi:hypothetical protein